MKSSEKIIIITRTAVFIALLILLQAMSKPFGQYLTGSLVNLTLILATLLGGLLSGSAVALISPFMAFLLGINHALPPVLLFIMLGNLSLVLIWYFIICKVFTSKGFKSKGFIRKVFTSNIFLAYGFTTIVAAMIKSTILYLGIVKLVVPLLNLPKPQAAVLSASFSFPQFITAVIGGAIAMAILPVLKVALKGSLSYH